MILLIDNYDSFSYNLYQLIGEIEPDIRVIRNDEMTVSLIWWAFPITEIISCFVGYVFLKRISKNKVDVLN